MNKILMRSMILGSEISETQCLKWVTKFLCKSQCIMFIDIEIIFHSSKSLIMSYELWKDYYHCRLDKSTVLRSMSQQICQPVVICFTIGKSRMC